MVLDRLFSGRLLRLVKKRSQRTARRPATVVPIIAGIPGTDVWFIRLALAFLVHLRQGGRVTHRLQQKVVGNPSGPEFNFDHVTGGPLLWTRNLLGPGHLFIGHTVCPGFARIANQVPWWQDAQFCAPGFDYFHEGLDYAQVPVDLAPHAYVTVAVSAMEAAAWTDPAQRAVLLYPDPIDQIAFYFKYCQGHPKPSHNRLEGRRLTEWPFRDYLFKYGLASYAKLFISYQAMAKTLPGSVSIVSHQLLLDRPSETLASILSHLSGKQRDWPMIDEAVDLAHRDHLVAVQEEAGRPWDRANRHPQARAGDSYEKIMGEPLDPRLRREALEFLASKGVEARYFSSPASLMAANG
jgi:hypothetical protein